MNAPDPMYQLRDPNKYDYLHAEDPQAWEYRDYCTCRLCCNERHRRGRGQLPPETVETAPDDPVTLHIPTLRVELKCEECGKEGTQAQPNYMYTLVGMRGVLCGQCLMPLVEEVRAYIQETKQQKGK